MSGVQTTLGALAELLGGRLVDGADPRAVVDGPVVVDSRAVAPGGLFVALPGARVDGHDFAADAVGAGAVAVLGARPVGVPAVIVDDPLGALGHLARDRLAASAATVIGVTGSSGKTTTKDLIGSVLATHGRTVVAPGSYNGEIGLPLSVLGLDPSTRFLVLEYGARGVGHIAGLTTVARPDIAAVLNVGVAHVGIFGSVEAIAQAKGELVEALDIDGVAVLNADDPIVREMASRSRARVVTVGRAVDADIRASDITLDDRGRPRFVLMTPAGAGEVSLRLHGEHHVANALAVAAVALEAGMSVSAICMALSAAEPRSRWRMEVVDTDDGVTVINDAYNANPASVRAALAALAVIGRGRRRWAVLGAMAELGAVTADAHREVGAFAAATDVDRLVCVGATDIADGARGTPAWAGRVDVVDGVDAATSLLRTDIRRGDVVLVKASRAAGLERVAAALVDGRVPA